VAWSVLADNANLFTCMVTWLRRRSLLASFGGISGGISGSISRLAGFSRAAIFILELAQSDGDAMLLSAPLPLLILPKAENDEENCKRKGN
jgi:hypothetical protein